MKAVIQKSGASNVKVNGKIVGQIKSGLVILIGITNNDSEREIDYIVNKISNLRLFKDGEKDFDRSVSDAEKEILLISQFTLYAETSKGRRPDFNNAAKSDIAKPLYLEIVNRLRDKGLKVETGRFGEEMEVNICNQGPITIILETPNKTI